jgi:uncharacterized protein YqjF (DUF2071 family)
LKPGKSTQGGKVKTNNGRNGIIFAKLDKNAFCVVIGTDSVHLITCCKAQIKLEKLIGTTKNNHATATT